MKHSRVVVALVLFSVSTIPLSHAAANAERLSIGAQVDTYVKPYVEMQDFSGAVLVARGGHILLDKAYGMASYELATPNRPTTRFRIASVSKQFTAAAILLLEQSGLLRTDNRITKFIPDFPRGDQITIHHLLTHNSGITGNMETIPEIERDPQAFHPLPELVEMLQKTAPESPAGLKTRYSNKNYVLLAYVVEKVSGEQFGSFLQRNIFEPLGMRDSGSEEYMELVRNIATGYEAGLYGVDLAQFDDWWNNIGAGNVYATVEDLYKWDRALRTEKPLTSASKKKMFTEYVQGGYGYGWVFRQQFGRRLAGHTGRMPGYLANISRYLDDDAVIIILGNIGSGAVGVIRKDLAAILFGEKYSLPRKRPRISLDGKALEQFVGLYEMGPGYLTVRKVKDHLVLKGEGTPYSVLTPESESSFFMRALYAEVIFQRDSSGKVTGLIWRQGGDFLCKKKP